MCEKIDRYKDKDAGCGACALAKGSIGMYNAFRRQHGDTGPLEGSNDI